MYSFPYLKPVGCSMSSSNCCFLTCIQISQEAGQVVWYSHLFQNFPQLIVVQTIKGFCIVNKAEIDVFLELSCFLDDPVDVGNLISGSFAFSKSSLNILKFTIRGRLETGKFRIPHSQPKSALSWLDSCSQMSTNSITGAPTDISSPETTQALRWRNTLF